ncbi:MAG: CHASE2 domain-containing protein, partial [bacterium]
MRQLRLSRQNGAASRDRARLRQQSVVLVAVVVVLMLVASLAGLLDGPELSAVDLAFRVRGPQPPASPVVIVAIDDNTLRNTNLQWPWPRTYFAQLLDRLAADGARLVAFDVFFHEPESVSAPATYTVQGESATQIADHYGVSTDALRAANGLDNAGTICDGRELTIPTTPPVTHIVTKDSVEKISARYRVDLERLITVNRLSNPCALIPTELLVVPISGPVTYTVQAGDTVASIAALFQMNPLAVLTPEAQPARDPLAPGQTVSVQFGDAALAASIKAAGNIILNGEIARTQELEELRQPLRE